MAGGCERGMRKETSGGCSVYLKLTTRLSPRLSFRGSDARLTAGRQAGFRNKKTGTALVASAAIPSCCSSGSSHGSRIVRSHGHMRSS